MSSVVGEGATENKIISLSRNRPRLPPREMALGAGAAARSGQQGAGEPGRWGGDQKVNGEQVHEWRPFTLEVLKIFVERLVFESGSHPHSDHE